MKLRSLLLLRYVSPIRFCLGCAHARVRYASSHAARYGVRTRVFTHALGPTCVPPALVFDTRLATQHSVECVRASSLTLQVPLVCRPCLLCYCFSWGGGGAPPPLYSQCAVASAEAVGSLVARDEVVKRLRVFQSSTDPESHTPRLSVERLTLLFAYRAVAARVASLEALVSARARTRPNTANYCGRDHCRAQTTATPTLSFGKRQLTTTTLCRAEKRTVWCASGLRPSSIWSHCTTA